MLVTVSFQTLQSPNLCSQYLNFIEPNDGIIVSDIKNWSLSGSYGFVFHTLLRLTDGLIFTRKTGINESAGDGRSERENCRRMLLK